MNQSKNEKRERPPTKWTYLQYKKGINKSNVPIDCFLHSATRIGSKILYYGGVNIYGEPLNQLFLYDTTRLSWIPPTEPFLHQEGFPGARYGHSSTLIAMHPPKVLIWGGSTNGGTFEFDIPDSVDNEGSHPTITANPFMSVRRQGRKNKFIEETDENIYFLELNDSTWLWSKPTLTSKQSPKPLPRNEHSMCKIGANEVLMFGGWTSKPMNDVWIFNFTDLTWAQQACSGIQPRPRYRHTAEVLGTSMFILGGSDTVTDESDGCSYLSIHELNIETMQWSHPILSGVNPFPRSGHGSAVVGASIIAIFGGKRNDEIYLNDLILIDTSSYICTQIDVVSSTIPSPITNSTLTAVGNKCYVFGGIDMDGSCYEGLREIDIGYHLNSSDISVAEGLASDYSFKILVIGNASVGKSAILSRFSEDVYTHNQHASTIGIDFTSKMIRVDRAICKLEIWDTAGQERFAVITANYYRGAQGALIVYDISERQSFEQAISWFERARQLGGENLIAVLIGNKNDLPEESRQVRVSEGEELASRLGISFIETSALTGTNIESVFVLMASAIKVSVDSKGLTGVSKGTGIHASNVQLGSGEKKTSLFDSCSCGF